MPRRVPGRVGRAAPRRARRIRRQPPSGADGAAPLASEPYEAWQPLAVALLGAPHHPHRTGGSSYVRCTRLLRSSADALWAGLRRWLSERGLDPAETVLVYLIPCGADMESGVLLTSGGRVHTFDLECRRGRDGAERFRILRRLDITDHWQTEPFSAEIADAFLWSPPPRPTRLPLPRLPHP